MKILSPLDSLEEVAPLAAAGAGEFFCGVLEEEWYGKYPVISINRRPAGKGHFRRFADLKAAADAAHDKGIPVYYTVNEHYYIEAQYPLIKKYIDGALEAAVDALIVSDFGLIAWLEENGYDIPLHISTGGTVFNRRSALFYKELGIQNITFPRHLDIDELQDLTAGMPDIETTAFILNSRCINVDGYCTFQHGLAGKEIFPMFRNACMLPFEVQIMTSGNPAQQMSAPGHSLMLDRQKVWEKVHVDDHPCGACALYEFREMGIGSVKVVGRGNPTERKAGDVAFLKELIDMLENEQPDRAAFRAHARKRYQETYDRSCRMHMCYYPRVMTDE